MLPWTADGPLDLVMLAHFEEAFQEYELPFRVDVIDPRQGRLAAHSFESHERPQEWSVLAPRSCLCSLWRAARPLTSGRAKRPEPKSRAVLENGAPPCFPHSRMRGLAPLTIADPGLLHSW